MFNQMTKCCPLDLCTNGINGIISLKKQRAVVPIPFSLILRYELSDPLKRDKYLTNIKEEIKYRRKSV